MVKRILDILFSLIAILLLSWVFVMISLLIYFKMGRPILFRQRRPGINGRPFFLYKFRSMTNSSDKNSNLMSDKTRLTKLGVFLRSTSLDELPGFWNVLRGEMSLVGPRPLLEEYLPLYDPTQRRRHEVKPGITGWAQINGRNAISWEEKFELDVWYVDNGSFWLDLKILFLTIIEVFKRKNISTTGEATTSKFRGKSNR
ncbi:sugar transferase [Alphaproteobacteria bacterium]|nr:sugar transferase [Alphaproteobacteria bacterium]